MLLIMQIALGIVLGFLLIRFPGACFVIGFHLVVLLSIVAIICLFCFGLAKDTPWWLWAVLFIPPGLFIWVWRDHIV